MNSNQSLLCNHVVIEVRGRVAIVVQNPLGVFVHIHSITLMRNPLRAFLGLKEPEVLSDFAEAAISPEGVLKSARYTVVVLNCGGIVSVQELPAGIWVQIDYLDDPFGGRLWGAQERPRIVYFLKEDDPWPV